MQIRKTLICFISLLILTGSFKSEMPRYSILIDNKTKQIIRQAAVYIGEFKTASANRLKSNTTSEYIGVPKPIPETVTVKWIDSQGNHSVRIDVASKLPRKHYEGKIIFIINPNGTVTLKYPPARCIASFASACALVPRALAGLPFDSSLLPPDIIVSRTALITLLRRGAYCLARSK